MGIKSYIAKKMPQLYMKKKTHDHCKYECDRFSKYSLLGMSKNDPRSICTQLKIYIHIIEKGFSMKNTKLGFGKEKLMRIIGWLDELNNYENTDYNKKVYEEAVKILNCYHQYAQKNGVDDSFIPERYSDADLDISDVGVREFTTSEMHSLKSLNFYDFAHARHSFRYYKDIPLAQEDIQNAVRLAQTAPSACNRQSVKVYCVNEKTKALDILTIQEGAKGFENVNSVFLVTSDITNYTYQKEYSAAYVDGALFLMNLLYSLNYYGIATCPLMFDDSEVYGAQVRKLLRIPQNEIIIGVVAAGYYEDKDMKYAASTRTSLQEVLVID